MGINIIKIVWTPTSGCGVKLFAPPCGYCAHIYRGYGFIRNRRRVGKTHREAQRLVGFASSNAISSEKHSRYLRARRNPDTRLRTLFLRPCRSLLHPDYPVLPAVALLHYQGRHTRDVEKTAI